MRPVVTVVLLVSLVSMGAMGCIHPDTQIESPLGTIPKILVDHINNTTKVYVQGLDDHRYLRISIRVYNGDIIYVNSSKDHVFTHYISFTRDYFTLNITVEIKKKVYGFEGNFTVDPPMEPNVVFKITTLNEKGEIKERSVKENNLPWRTLAERIQ